MEIKQFVFNPFQENTYIAYTDHQEAIIIDPGCYSPVEENQLRSFIDSKGLKVLHLVNTHLHLDHAFGNRFVEETWKVVTEAHAGDDFWLKGMAGQCRMFGLELRKTAPNIGKELREGDHIQIGTESFEVLHVPGHSPGSIVLHHAKAHLLFVGDVLFENGIGRTDLQGGNYAQLIKGIQEKLLVLPDDTIVYSGHGSATTIGKEKASNPFL
ncbi:MAG TPA: MBL fold metallo-hydrolase [Bacteroidales bacterium]|nr:MBL fold metallo-hydrolase [Bacteroidales bacterium]